MMANFAPLAASGRCELVERSGALLGDTPSQVLYCDVVLTSDLPPLQPPTSDESGAFPRLLAADDEGKLRELFQMFSQTPPKDEIERDGERIRRWVSEEDSRDQTLCDALKHALVRPLSTLPLHERVSVAVTPLSDPGLRFWPVHRGIRGLNPFHPERFLAIVNEYAQVFDIATGLHTAKQRAEGVDDLARAVTAEHPHAVLMVLPGGVGKILRFRQALDLTHLRAPLKSPTLRSLDLALLNSLVFTTVLGISEADKLPHPNVVPVRSLDALMSAVHTGSLQAGFIFNPIPVWEVRAVMEAHQELPAQTTWLGTTL